MRKRRDSRTTHDISKCITTRHDNTRKEVVFVVISQKGKDNVIILNDDTSEQLLRRQLVRLGYDADGILSRGIRLTNKNSEKFSFQTQGRITTQTTQEQMWTTFHRGDVVKVYFDGTFKTVPQPLSRWKYLRNQCKELKEVITKQCKELKEDTIVAFQECNDDFTAFVEMLDEQQQ